MTPDFRRPDVETRPGAILSPGDSAYRYLLWRPVSPLVPKVRALLWIMLNPSTADASSDDPTIRKVIGFTERNDFNLARVANLWALRSTDWKALRKHPNPIGPENDRYLRVEIARADAIVLAWGNHALDVPGGRERIAHVTRMLEDAPMLTPIFQLGRTKIGMPFHPLMISYDTPLRGAFE